MYGQKCLINVSRGSVEIEADEKTMKTLFKSNHGVICNIDLSVVLGVTKKNCPVGTHLGGKPTNITDIDTVNLKCKFVH